MGLKPVSRQPDLADRQTILWFGRYRDCQVADILEEDPNYLLWAQDAIEGFDIHYELMDICERYHVTDTTWEKQTEYFWRGNN